MGVGLWILITIHKSDPSSSNIEGLWVSIFYIKKNITLPYHYLPLSRYTSWFNLNIYNRQFDMDFMWLFSPTLSSMISIFSIFSSIATSTYIVTIITHMIIFSLKQNILHKNNICRCTIIGMIKLLSIGILDVLASYELYLRYNLHVNIPIHQPERE